MVKNRIASVLVVVCAVLLHLWADTALSLAFLLVAIAVPLVLLVQLRMAAAYTRITVEVQPTYQLGERNSFYLRLVRGLPVCLAPLSLTVSIKNKVFGVTEEAEIEAMLSTLHPVRKLAMFSSQYGRVLVEANKARLTDPLKLFSVQVPFEMSCESVIRPAQIQTEVLLSQKSRAHTFGDSFDSGKSGHDVGEVFDVREYVAGDSLSSIHWKLSSKFDALIARQFSCPADYDVALIACGCQEVSSEACNGVAALTLSLSEALLRAGVFHDGGLLYEQRVNCSLIDDAASHAAFSEKVLSTPLPQSVHEVSQVLASEALSDKFTKVILITCFYDEAVWADLAQAVDLTVVVVADDDLTQSSELVNERYGLFTLQAKELIDHEHRITL